jgi:hypothetical protein
MVLGKSSNHSLYLFTYLNFNNVPDNLKDVGKHEMTEDGTTPYDVKHCVNILPSVFKCMAKQLFPLHPHSLVLSLFLSLSLTHTHTHTHTINGLFKYIWPIHSNIWKFFHMNVNVHHMNDYMQKHTIFT